MLGIVAQFRLNPYPQTVTSRSHAIRFRAGLALAALAISGCHRPGFPSYPASFREFAYIANSGSNTVTVLDLVYLRVDRTLRVGEHPIAIAANPRRNEVYVLNAQRDGSSGSLSVINTGTNEVEVTIPLQRDPAALSVDSEGRRAFVANKGSNTVSMIDLDAQRVVATIPTPAHPASAVISPDGRSLIVVFPDSGSVGLYAVAVSGTASPDKALRQRSVFNQCAAATNPVVLPDASKAFIACPGTNQVLVLQLASEPGSWAARQNVNSLSDHALALLDVGPDPMHLTLKPDGGEIFTSNVAAGSVSEVSTWTNETSNTFPIGDDPAEGIVSADNSALWIANTGSDSVSLYSIEDGKLITSIHTGAGPDALALSNEPEGAQNLLLVADKRSGDVALIRTSSKLAPGLMTMLPAGQDPSAIAIKSTAPTP